MKEIKIICPRCEDHIFYRNWFHWIWKTPFHWFGKRKVRCPYCDHVFYGKPIK